MRSIFHWGAFSFELYLSAGGNKARLLGPKKEERDKGDERVLGSGDFVMNVIKEANELLDERAEFNLTLDELVSRVCSRFGIMFDELVSKNRRRRLSQARAAVSYLAVDKLGYTGEDVARLLKVSGRSVSNCRERGKILVLCRLPRRWEPSYWGEMPFSSIFHWYDKRGILLESLAK